VSSQLKDVVQQWKQFFLALNERTDISDMTQFLVFIRTVDEDFTIHEELLSTPLHVTAKGSDIYNSLVSVLDEYGRFAKRACVVRWCQGIALGRTSHLKVIV